MSEIASAFVRIRPEMTGFKNEVATNTRSAFAGAAKAAVGAFAVFEGFHFAKDIITEAGQVQKAMEVVDSQFGKSSGVIKDWSEHAAAQLGVTDDAALATASRFGILFKNLGIGKPRAAEMTLGFEKLAASMAAIQGKDPTDLLNKIVLAAAGNTRGLKQMGIVVDTAGIKQEALRQHLIKTTKDAITPAIKAQAIYGIATRHLGEFQKEAAKHSSDYANVTRRFAAVWDDFTDQVGLKLLPVMAKLVGFLADSLPKATEILRKGLGLLIDTVKTWAGIIGPAFTPIIDEVNRLRDAFGAGGIGAAIERLRTDFTNMSPAGKAAAVAIGAVGAALAVAFVAANPILATVAAIVALTEGFKYAYEHSQRFREAVNAIVADVQAKWPQIKATIESVMAAVTGVVQAGVAIIQYVWQHYGDLIVSQVRAEWELIKGTIQNALEVIRGIVNIVGGLLHGDWSRVWQGIQQVFGGVTAQILNLARFFATTLGNLFQALGRATLAVLSAAWNELKGLAASAFNAIVGVLRNAVGTAGNAAKAIGTGIVNGVKAGLEGLFAAVKGGLDRIWGIISNVAKLAYNAAKAIGAEIIHGIIDGFKGLVAAAGNELKKAGEGLVHHLDPRNLNPFSPVSHWAILLGEEIKKGFGSLQAILGPTLARELEDTLRQATQKAETTAVKGMGNAAGAIIAAARKAGVEARAALAVAMTEGGTSFGAVGDKGTSFGPFQLHIGGASPFSDPAKAAAFANSIQGVTYALRQMAAAGAAGKTGFDAIQAIVTGFERPANPSAEIAKALSYYKEIPAQLGAALSAGGTVLGGTVVRQMVQVGALVRQYGRIIGLDHARAVVEGIIGGTPGIVAQVRAAMVQAVAEMRAARAQAASAFNDLASAALAAFDAKVAAWKNPIAAKLTKMQAEDAAKQVRESVADAVAAILGAGDQLATLNLGEQLATATTAQLNAAIAQAQAAAQAAVDQAKGALAQANNDVAAAQAAFDLAKATGGDTAAAQQKLDEAKRAQAEAAQKLTDAVNQQKQLDDAVRAQQEAGLAAQAAAKQAAHDKQAARDRENLARDLANLKKSLLEHPKAWKTSSDEVMALLKKYEVPMFDQGKRWASQFSAGLREGLVALQSALKEFAAHLPHSPAEKGPLAFDLGEHARRWGESFGPGLAAGIGAHDIAALISGSLRPPGTNGPGGVGAGPDVALVAPIRDFTALQRDVLLELRKQTALLDAERPAPAVEVHVRPSAPSFGNVALEAAR